MALGDYTLGGAPIPAAKSNVATKGFDHTLGGAPFQWMQDGSAASAQNFAPDVATGSGQAYAPVITGSGAASFAPAAAGGSGQAYAPAVTGDGAASFSPAAAAGTGSAYAPATVGSGDAAFDPGAATGTGQAYDASIGFVSNTTGEGSGTAAPATGYALGTGLIPINQLGVIIGDKVLVNLPIVKKPAAKSGGVGRAVGSRAISRAEGFGKKYLNSAVGRATASKAKGSGMAALDYEAQNEEELALLL